MSDMNTVPPLLPPAATAAAAIAPPLSTDSPLGTRPEELQAIRNPVAAVEAILRQPRRVMYQLRQPGAGGLLAAMLLVVVLCSLVYGVVVGAFSMGAQLWAAPLKVTGGLLVATLICLPSLYIFTCLSGAQARLAEVCGLVLGLLLLMTLLLIGFAPVAWLFSQSTTSAVTMGVLHLLFWFVATCFGLRFLSHAFSHARARSRAGLNTWIVLFVLVVVQMTTALRPLIGTANTFFPKEKKFFITHWVDCLNAAAGSTQSAPSDRAAQ